jgi:hypothetical protein
MQIDDYAENSQVNGLAELEAKEDLQWTDALYAVTVQLTVKSEVSSHRSSLRS